jgi:HSP20 family protein
MVEKSHTAGWFPELYEPFRNIGRKVAEWFAPRSEASASSDDYEISVELPGVKLEDVDVSVHDNVISITGEKRYEHSESGRTFFFSEREYGAFQRSFRLPPDADSNSIEANFSDGVLNLRVKKQVQKQSTGKKVTVKRG